MTEVNELYDYPVTVTAEDFVNHTNYDLQKDIVQSGAREDNVIREFLFAVHSTVYDSVIYATGDKRIKDAIIRKYLDKLGSPIKRALLAQGVYMIENGDAATWSGITLNAGGAADVKDSNVIKVKAVCQRTLDILSSTSPKITYAGEIEQ